MNCGFKAFSRQFREAGRYCRVLKRQVIDVIPGGMSPAIDPNSAEVAVSIEDEERFFRGLPDTQVQTHPAFIAIDAVVRQLGNEIGDVVYLSTGIMGRIRRGRIGGRAGKALGERAITSESVRIVG